jgi:sigma-B regulation protein RsbU (phosphoserine phosphatase)
MAMAKSALSVQASFDPEVAAVFATLNRMVYQSARRRLLSTLCYALIDRRAGRLTFASAGHVFPYRVVPDGRVETLESIAYPLGVRLTLAVQVREHEIAAGDALFLFSDGLVEASREGDHEPFGFTRLEQSLARHAGKSAAALRDAVIADVRAFTRYAPQTDDLTVLVLRLPA